MLKKFTMNLAQVIKIFLQLGISSDTFTITKIIMEILLIYAYLEMLHLTIKTEFLRIQT